MCPQFELLKVKIHTTVIKMFTKLVPMNSPAMYALRDAIPTSLSLSLYALFTFRLYVMSVNFR
jgi:hypothetical protein